MGHREGGDGKMGWREAGKWVKRRERGEGHWRRWVNEQEADLRGEIHNRLVCWDL